ncbi:MAG: peptide deformylase [Deltaproteobacteria bacterium]|nr:peptide deformylase [Deltaproteobacteria bacterium]
MLLLEILKYPDPFLKTKASEVKSVESEVKTLIASMIETMYLAKGIGLAAVQVGVAKRVIVLDVPDENVEERQKGKNLVALVNPVIVKAEGETKYEEGCLSVPGITADVMRASTVAVRALDREGSPIQIEATGLFAIALQHEIDHLDGVLFIDRLSRLKREIVKRKLKKAFEAERAL